MADETTSQPKAPPAPKPREGHPPRTSKGTNPDRALLALAFFALLALGCWFLVRELHRDSSIQDCIMAGHRNCDPDASPVGDR